MLDVSELYPSKPNIAYATPNQAILPYQFHFALSCAKDLFRISSKFVSFMFSDVILNSGEVR